MVKPNVVLLSHRRISHFDSPLKDTSSNERIMHHHSFLILLTAETMKSKEANDIPNCCVPSVAIHSNQITMPSKTDASDHAAIEVGLNDVDLESNNDGSQRSSVGA